MTVSIALSSIHRMRWDATMMELLMPIGIYIIDWDITDCHVVKTTFLCSNLNQLGSTSNSPLYINNTDAIRITMYYSLIHSM